MCYPKPGPRCSSHAQDSGANANEELSEDELAEEFGSRAYIYEGDVYAPLSGSPRGALYDLQVSVLEGSVKNVSAYLDALNDHMHERGWYHYDTRGKANLAVGKNGADYYSTQEQYYDDIREFNSSHRKLCQAAVG